MKENKSIDGLVTRGSKSRPTTSVTKIKTSTKPKATPKPKKTILSEIVAEEDISIKVNTSPITEPPIAEDTKPKQTVDDFLAPTSALDLTDMSDNKKVPTPPTTKDSDNKSKEKVQKPKKKVSKARKIASIVALVIVLIIAGLALWAVFWGNDIIAKITGGQGNVFDLLTFTNETYDPLKTDSNGRTNILAFGTSGYNMEGDEGNGVHDGAQLTDSIMMISLNQETGDIAMLSLPRDLKASPTCTATGKINEVY